MSTEPSTWPATCGPGRSRRAGGRPCAIASASTGSASRPPASGCGSCGGRASACARTSCSPRCLAKSWTSGFWPPSSSSSASSPLLQLPLDRREDALAVLAALLVVPDLAQLGRGEVGEARPHLGGRQLVVGGDREVRTDAGAAA